MSSNHLDLGTGTGYFLSKCRFPTPSPRIVLMDLNPNCLASAAKRVQRYNPEIYQCNALDPIPMRIDPFDSVAIMNLMHCLPGTMESKAVIFAHIKDLLNPGGHIFGSSIIGRGIHPNVWDRHLLKYCNLKGYMTNYEDDYDSLKEGLDQYFRNTFIRNVGCMVLFAAQK